MYKITTRVSPLCQVELQDQKTFVDWVWKARDINCFDPDVLSYPRAVMYTADDQGGPLLYLPVQPVLMCESLAPRPGASAKQIALALFKIGEMLNETSQITGIQEQYFLCKHDQTADFIKKHGFEEMKDYRILKRKAPVIQLPEPTQGQ